MNRFWSLGVNLSQYAPGVGTDPIPCNWTQSTVADREDFAHLACSNTALLHSSHPWEVCEGLYRNQEKRLAFKNALTSFQLPGLIDLQKMENVDNKISFTSWVGFNKLLQLERVAPQLCLISAPDFTSLCTIQGPGICTASSLIRCGHLQWAGNHQ